MPGSRELVTRGEEGDELLLRIEGAEAGPGPAPLLSYQGEWLGGAVFESGIRVPAAVFDDLMPRQTPLEQSLYIHLFRLAYGAGKNWCRVGKRELMQRSRLSDRRLNVGLDGLVSKGHVKPLHRNTRGTLYRVYLPSEVLGSAPETGLVLGEKETPAPAPPAAPAPARTGAKGLRERPLESPLNEERFADVSGKKVKGPGVGEMANWFFQAKGKKAQPRDRQLAVMVLTGLLEDGFSREEVQKALTWFAQNLPEENNLERLPYFISQALEESKKSDNHADDGQ